MKGCEPARGVEPGGLKSRLSGAGYNGGHAAADQVAAVALEGLPVPTATLPSES